MSNRLDQQREDKLQPQRMRKCQVTLESLGYKVEVFEPDRLEFEHKGQIVKFWPYSGWHSGRSIEDGRGFGILLTKLEKSVE